MEEDRELLYQKLHKLPSINSNKELQHIVDTQLWRTHKTGVSSSEKSHIIALLDLPDVTQLHLVSVNLRSLIRKCVYHDLSTDELSKVFPSDMSIDLQSSLATVFQKYQSQWEEEVARDQEALPCLKSMTWTLNNRSKTPITKVALISLELQDYTKSPLGEIEVKFQLTRDKLEAMLESMTPTSASNFRNMLEHIQWHRKRSSRSEYI